jgi:hypothetical protein
LIPKNVSGVTIRGAGMDKTILIYRMDHTDPAIAMPELGRSTVHTEGVLLVSEWIAGLDGGC